MISSVKIGKRKYKVAYEDMTEDLWGHIEYKTQTIHVNNTIPLIDMQVTLLHEIMHGIFNEMGRKSNMKDEDLICAISECLYSVIRDNPKMIQYIRQNG